MLQWDLSERVLEEVGRAHHPESDRPEVEEGLDGPGARPLVGQEHDVGLLRLDDVRERAQRTEIREVAVAVCGLVSDEPEHLEG